MYEIEFLKNALQDIIDELSYLKDGRVASLLLREIMDGIKSISEFPYQCRVYVPSKPLKQEYRALNVKRYKIYYCVNEYKKTVTIMRMVYTRRDGRI